MANLVKLAKELKQLDDKLVKCMRCGTCQSVCPIFAQSLKESDVTRGKLALISNLSKEIIKDASAVRERLDRCLLCGSCQSTCPSGVSILEIFMKSRAICVQYIGLNPIKKIIFRQMLCRPKLFAFLMNFSWASKLVFFKDKNPQNTCSSPFLKFAIGNRHIPELPSKTFSQEFGDFKLPVGKSGIKVLFFPGCMGDKLYVSTTKACIKIFKHYGVGVEIPKNMSCCGIPALASGDVESFKRMATLNIDTFANLNFDYLVTACASCTETIKDFWKEYLKDTKYSYLAESISAKTIDISKFVVDVLKLELPDNSEKVFSEKITYHDSCHLKKSLGIWQEPRKLLKANPKYEFVEMKNSDVCCGCGGSFTLTHYDLSKKIGDRKATWIDESGATTVAAGCPACMMQITNALALKHSKVKVKHVAEIFAESIDD